MWIMSCCGRSKSDKRVRAGGERVEYATLIVATGSRWPDFMELPKTDAEKKTHLGTWRGSFKDAKHVVVVGGGAVGIGTC